MVGDDTKICLKKNVIFHKFRGKRCRYEMKILYTSSHYDGGISTSTKSHTLSCKVGGLIHSPCDESYEVVNIFASTGFDEPLINVVRVKGEGETGMGKRSNLVGECSRVDVEICKGENGDRGELLIQGLWEKCTTLINDVRICIINQLSYKGRKLRVTVISTETDKKKKYLHHCIGHRRHFTSLVVLC